ncbi:hypothetical protein [Metabacillus fastidiosus]|uniref:hypothetical protein n=1 Tax=Metabacillus fastidiosus TaxID=1458 RepID=UPI003D2D2590
MEITIVAKDFQKIDSKLLSQNILRKPHELQISYKNGKNTLNIVFDKRSLNDTINELKEIVNHLEFNFDENGKIESLKK